jgi:hypothetical protein
MTDLRAEFDKTSDDVEAVQHRAILHALLSFFEQTSMQRRLDMFVEYYWTAKREISRNPLLKTGEKYFSQNDEDGITLEIIRRIGIKKGVALEYGVGDGLENNTLILLMSGWDVIWIGGEDIKIRIPENCKNLLFRKDWVTKENCTMLVSSCLEERQRDHVDFLSIDLDGNDIHILRTLLASGLRPAILVVEYNGKFPPPIKWETRYNPEHRWDGSDYQGASIQSFTDLAEQYGYRLVCCNISGVNAYFVRSEFSVHFQDVPEDIADIFYPADYNWFIRKGHNTAPETIEIFLES